MGQAAIPPAKSTDNTAKNCRDAPLSFLKPAGVLLVGDVVAQQGVDMRMQWAIMNGMALAVVPEPRELAGLMTLPGTVVPVMLLVRLGG